MPEFQHRESVIPVRIEVHWGPAGPIWHEDSSFFDLAVVEANGRVLVWQGAALHRQQTGYQVLIPDQYRALPQGQWGESHWESRPWAYRATVIQAVLDSALRERP